MKISPELSESVKFIKKRGFGDSEIGIILGSGLGSFADALQEAIRIPTDRIPHFPHSTVHGHKGNLVYGQVGSLPLIVLQGRTHYYEGYPLERVTYIVRIFKALGIKILIVTNASGGINPLLTPGDLMLISDQINFMFGNPLRGAMTYGEPRFPDMSDPYNRTYHDLVLKVALDTGVDLKQGVLFVSTGPSYETGAEVKMASKLGADAVSMSTAPEVIAAKHAGLDVIGISCITNMATGINSQPLTHDEVTQTAEFAKNKFINLVTGIIRQLYPSR
jgi:purine-nucleoside phosphorylase